MKSILVNLSESQQIKNFVNVINKYSFDIDLCSGRYVVDAKSILGIFSLDLSKPIELQIFSDDNAEIEKFMADIAPFLA
ncbi:MAG: HPr family phosphocarrier protein [Clostridia bacterium]|nr:HPr family phosphocarrier protein [Clostridia bacterium]